MDPSLEIRKVPIAKLTKLIQILDSGESWKKLMVVIPKSLEGTGEFVPKYGMNEMGLIEDASRSRGVSCTQILFDEWGTSGRKRPTLAHLLELLTQCEHFRAADFVSIKLLNGSPVKRPDEGPAARVNISLHELLQEQDMKKLDSMLNGMEYPDINSKFNITTFNQNLDNKTTKEVEDKKYQFLNVQTSSDASKNSNSKLSPSTKSTDLSPSVSDLIMFSSSSLDNNANIPAFSRLFSNSNDNVNNKQDSINDNATDSDVLQTNSDYTNGNVEAVNSKISNSFGNVTDSSENVSVPNLSIFNVNSQTNIPDFSLIQGNSELVSSESNIPDFNAIRISQSYISTTSVESESNNIVSSNIPNVSGLQNAYSNATDGNINSDNSIIIDTMIPHYKFEVLQKSTKNFEDKETFDENNKLLSGKIGDGGFGSVYLSRSLIHIPVAIKKLNINYSLTNANEDILKKLFKSEIETLTKCNHENILTLLGYSCDTECLCVVSEFMECGSLQDNLAKNKNLTPDIRLNIAIGTARGIDYLHNSFDTPLIHRDIKSANILLTENYIPKICDFGLVKHTYSNHTVQTTKIIGTTAYMSPEAFRGDVSVKMDVFSFGVILLELLTSLPPMDDKRANKDIVTHFEVICDEENGFDSLLDKTIGEWRCAEELYKIATQCLEEKKRRPYIKVILEKLVAL